MPASRQGTELAGLESLIEERRAAEPPQAPADIDDRPSCRRLAVKLEASQPQVLERGANHAPPADARRQRVGRRASPTTDANACGWERFTGGRARGAGERATLRKASSDDEEFSSHIQSALNYRDMIRTNRS